MNRAHAAVALLAASWLLGLPYYRAENWTAWAALVAAGALLLAGAPARLPGRGPCAAVILLASAAAWVMPWPHRAGPLLLAGGAVLAMLPPAARRVRALAAGLAAAGAVLLVQAAAVEAYACLTARSHDLPWPLPHVVWAAARILGAEAAVDGPTVALFTMRQAHRLAATWELFFDPATLAFLAGGGAAAALAAWAREPAGGRAEVLAGSLLRLGAVVAAWLPVRAGLLVALYLHRALRTDYDAPLALMDQFWSPWVLGGLLGGPVLLAWRFVPLAAAARAQAEAAGSAWRPPAARRALAGALALAAGAALAGAACWDAPGERKAGRVLVDEFHSRWERTDRPFDTEWYGRLSGYNYACIYDYSSRFYEMGRLQGRADDEALAACDVLVVKAPTSRCAPEEAAAVRRFVERGGGLLLVGEHTNVFGTSDYLNDLARPLGFEFRYDCLFGIDSLFEERLRRPAAAHPILQHVPELGFAVSCSIAPGASAGSAVVLQTGLKNLPADYHASNFYPQPEDRPDMRYGAFVQLWAARHGRGRVAAFTDSTIFSNFSAFEPGASELWLGMLEWLNHAGGWDARPWLALAAALLAAGALAAARGWPGAWLALAAAGALGVAAGTAAADEANRRAMPPPQAARPLVCVVIDRTVCDAPLGRAGFIGGRRDGFGIFEQWVLRLGYFTARRAGAEALAGDAVVFLYPNREPPPRFRDALVRYVVAGGRVLVVDSAENEKSAADALAAPFGLALGPAPGESGELAMPEGWPSAAVEAARTVSGGTAFARLGGKPVAAFAEFGKGMVAVVGFGARFTDANMGVTADVVPDAAMERVFRLEYAIIRGVVAGRLPEVP